MRWLARRSAGTRTPCAPSRTSPVDDSTSPPDATGRFACGSRRTTRVARGGSVPPRRDVELEAWERRKGGFESAFERERPLETPSCLQFEDPVTKMLAKEAARAGADARRDAEREEAREREAEEEARARQAMTSLGRRLAEIEAADAAERPRR